MLIRTDQRRQTAQMCIAAVQENLAGSKAFRQVYDGTTQKHLGSPRARRAESRGN